MPAVSCMPRFLSRLLYPVITGFSLAAFLLASCPAALPAQTSASTPEKFLGMAPPALIPMPREFHKGGSFSLASGISVSLGNKSVANRFTAQDLVKALQKRGIAAGLDRKGKVKIILLNTADHTASKILAKAHLTFDPVMQTEGYALVPDGRILYDIAATDTGLFYGAQTIKQLVRGNGSNATLDTATVRDWPAMRYRGLSDDLSRGPIPTLKFQEHQIRVLSEYKVNIYSPYFENTLQYSANPVAASPGGAMSKADVQALVEYARKYHVTIVPEQEAFGHLHHTLEYDIYSPLAETPHGTVLAPGQPGSLPLIKSWFTEIAQIFPGPFIHIGADETFDLGKGQTKSQVEKEGLGAVYISFLRQIYTTLAPLHKTILFWGDIAMNSPELVKTLPKDMIAVAWVYNPQPDGYDKWLMPYVNANMQTWVAPGVNNWRRVYPDFNAGFENIQKFVADGQRLGSTGELNTVWNDEGEGLFNLDWYGVLYGAAAGWQPGTSNIAQFQQAYGQVFHGDPTGDINQAQIELMAAQHVLESAGLASTTRFSFWVDPWSPRGQEISTKLLPVVTEMRLHTERAIMLIDEIRGMPGLRETDALDAMEMGARRLDFLGYKFEAAQQIADEYRLAYSEQNDPERKRDVIHELGTIAGVDGQCADLRDGYGLTHDLYRAAWLKENREYSLDTVMAQYEMAMQLWIKRGNQFGDIIHSWYQMHTLPTPESLGLPLASAPATNMTPTTKSN
jgi:hexosaminidase